MLWYVRSLFPGKCFPTTALTFLHRKLPSTCAPTDPGAAHQMADDAPPRDEASYLAESQEGLLYAMFIIPIPLEILSTMFRLWVKARKTASRRIASDDYLMIFAVVGA